MGGTTGSARLRTAVTGGERDFLPGMRQAWLLPLYDPITRLAGVGRVHRRLLDQAALRPGQRVLEIGCGTGNLLLAAKRAQPEAVVVGLDPDLAALARAHRKARRRGLTVQLDRGHAEELPYADDGMDVVLSSFMLHHVPADQRDAAVREVLRVLRPGGALHLVDVGGSDDRGHRHRFTREHAVEDAPELLARAGFRDVAATGTHVHRLFGAYTLYRATG
ncbi:class I SAM-dependent methyltransferase [Geodermatophilus sp. DSM 45219]|uniref:class I SAM-dependent methyltransferase n=1 Tax=Geodermatophilus sp. DSM 45219 TaxID=1881103 RepID=UPI0008919B7E|nr:class I SAM-dependent methyltransferase [Geodermatophilus sp. DSM 45219]SDN38924.1 Methyltransferase domain-containing protein [Geodermatophilus sp. DSM 45219]